jgi:mono/diheme cytochrome c family protein
MSVIWRKVSRWLALPKLVRVWIVMILLAGLLLAGCQAESEDAPQATATATSPYAAEMMAQGFVELVGDDLAAAPVPVEASQADLGEEVYRQICLACHGDWGQGLTDAWREEWDEDSNCWQSRCHAPNHPPQGFQLPKAVPAVLGPGSLSRFNSAAELQRNISETMPWWNPGSLTDKQTWQISAYLMRARGELGDEVTLDAGNAAVYKLHVTYRPTPDPRPGIFLLSFSLAIVTVALIRRGRP